MPNVRASGDDETPWVDGLTIGQALRETVLWPEGYVGEVPGVWG